MNVPSPIRRISISENRNSTSSKATVLGLADMGATVVMVCSDPARGEFARSEILTLIPDSSVDLFIADLSSSDSIRRLVEDFTKKYRKLHVLADNTGVPFSGRRLTGDGIEQTFTVNHLAHSFSQYYSLMS